MSFAEGHSPEGHRDRLRRRFQQEPDSLSDAEKLELLLTYAIPRRDVAPLANKLLSHFGSLAAIFAAPISDLTQVEGVGESTAIFLQLVHHLSSSLVATIMATESEMSSKQYQLPSPQLHLFEMEPNPAAAQPPKEHTAPKERSMRVFANDEVANSLAFLPKAADFQSLDDFKRFLADRLPYNSAETRSRRANYFLDRFYSWQEIDTPLTFYASHCSSPDDLKPAVFYHILKAEPMAARVAEELIWPALPIGRIEREQIREFILRLVPDMSASSQANAIRSFFYTYNLSGVGSTSDATLRFQLRKGTLESFLYLLTCEYPNPGMYSFESLYASPLHHWLLWDREWMRMQLYNLQDFGIVSKVSEIDTVRQFTVGLEQRTALAQFFSTIQDKQPALRDDDWNTYAEGEGGS